MNIETDMDRVIAFVREFIRADLDAEKIGGLLDQAEYSKRINILKDFFVDGMGPGLPLVLPAGLDDDIRGALEAQARELRPRILFKLRRWEHPNHGVLYQAYLSSTEPSKSTGYFQSLLIKDVRGRLKIVARYTVCLACFATGRHAGKRCPDCYAPGWDYREGLKLKTFGKLRATRRLEAPTDPVYLPEYESD